MRKINDSKGDLLCIVYKDEDWVEGLNFITDNSLFIQVGSWWYQDWKNLAKHKHNIVPRQADITQEMVYVKSGSMLATIFDQEMIFVEEIIQPELDDDLREQILSDLVLIWIKEQFNQVAINVNFE